MRGKVIVGLVAFCMVLLGAAAPVRADRDWVIGRWQIRQNFSAHHQEAVFKGRLTIRRDGHHFTGRIYFDSVGRWEELQDVKVSDDTIRFFRPEYPQDFHGRHTQRGIEGTWKDRTKRDKEWTWEAERE